MKPAVFLDRDGTMIHEVEYLSRPEDVRWFSWSLDAIRLLNRAGYAVCVATNQGGIGLGYYPEQFVLDTHREMNETAQRAGAHVDGWFYCPHHPRAVIDALRVPCTCRKPARGMADQAASALGIDLSRSFVIGDKRTDIEFARSFGGRGIFVRTGHGQAELTAAGGAMSECAVTENLMEATAWILRN